MTALPLFLVLLAVIVFLMLDIVKNNKRRVKEYKKSPWEKVPGGMDRIEVPGGWIYRDYISGHSIALTFVPKIEEQKPMNPNPEAFMYEV